MLTSLALLTLSGCSSLPDFDWPSMPSLPSLPSPPPLPSPPAQPTLALARALDTPPPPVTVERGSLPGEVLAGAMLPVIPDSHVDEVIAPELRPWLTPLERRRLAEASQHAAVGVTGAQIEWKAIDSSGDETASGIAMPMHDAMLSVHGQLCRDLWQEAKKDDKPHQQQVTLCRVDYGDGLFVWSVGSATQWP